MREGPEGLPVDRRSEAAANEEFAATVIRRDGARREGGWDPYEVWQTRVRTPPEGAQASKDPPREP